MGASPATGGDGSYFQNLLRGLAVTLIHCHKEKGHHKPDHQKLTEAVFPIAVRVRKIHRQANRPGNAEKNKLPFRQIKGNFGLNLRQIFWNRYIGQKITFFPSNACRRKNRAGTFLFSLYRSLSWCGFLSGWGTPMRELLRIAACRRLQPVFQPEAAKASSIAFDSSAYSVFHSLPERSSNGPYRLIYLSGWVHDEANSISSLTGVSYPERKAPASDSAAISPRHRTAFRSRIMPVP